MHVLYSLAVPPPATGESSMKVAFLTPTLEYTPALGYPENMEAGDYGWFGQLPKNLCPLGQCIFGVQTETSAAKYWLIDQKDGKDFWLYDGSEQGFLQHSWTEPLKRWLLALADEKLGPATPWEPGMSDEEYALVRRDIDLWGLAADLMEVRWVQGSYGAFVGPESGSKYRRVKKNLSPLYSGMLSSDKSRESGLLLQAAVTYLEDEALTGEVEFLYGLYSEWFRTRNQELAEELCRLTDKL